MLTRNLWTSRGLTSGSVGVVKAVVAEEVGQPRLVLVEFQSYSGPAWDPARPKLIPVPLESSNENGTQRWQVPLALCWGRTIHKSQGQTWDRVVIHLGTAEFTLGISYVALSRAKSLDGILLKGLFSYDRLAKVNGAQRHVRRQAAEAWLATLPEGVSD